MRKLVLWCLAVIVALGAIVVFAGPLLISQDQLRDQAFAKVESLTGYRLSVSGPVRFSMFPSFDLVAEDVAIAPSTPSDAAEIATAKTLRFDLSLSALLTGKVQMKQVTMVDPVFRLPEASQAAGEADASDRGATGLPQSLSLEELIILNGTVIMPGSRDGEPEKLEGLELDASLPDANGALSFDMQGVYQGKKLQVAGSIGSFSDFLDRHPAPIEVRIAAADYFPKAATVAGTASYGDNGLRLADFTARIGEYAISGDGTYRDRTLRLDSLTAGAGDQSVTGTASVAFEGDRPSITAALSAQTLDFNALSSKIGAGPLPGLGNTGPGWSSRAIDLSPLHALDGDLKLAVGKLVYGPIKIDSAEITATLANGKLTADFPTLKLYNGAGRAALTIDASGKTPTHRLRLSLANLDASPFLRDTVEFERLSGKGAINAELTASGDSERAIVSTLSGAAKLEAFNGVIRGVNFANVLRRVANSVVTGWQVKQETKTDFNRLGGSFKIAAGTAQTEDLQLIGPLVRMGGAGTIELPARTLKLRVNPLVLASVQGGEGKNNYLGFPVPIAVSGPWARPSIYPDIAGILENPVAAYQQLDKLGGGLISVPANLVGIDTGGKGLVETGVALPGALTKGAIEGVGQILGTMRPDGAAKPAEPANR